MLRNNPSRREQRYSLLVDGVSIEFLPTPDGIKVSMHVIHTPVESYGDSLGTMDTSPTLMTFVAKEISLLISSHLRQRRTSP